MKTTTTVPTTLAETIKARREDIAQQAECLGCGTTLERCKTIPRNDAPFRCCSAETHLPRGSALVALLKEIESGFVRPVAEIVAEREAEAARQARLRDASTPPGERWPLDYGAMFRQAKWWMTKDTGWVRIADMEPSHRANTVRFLERRAAAVAHKAAWSDYSALGDAPERVVNDMLQQADDRRDDPMGWLQNTPLYRALAHDMEVDVAPRADDIATPDGRPQADHPFHGAGTTCSKPIEGVGDDFIRCGRGVADHPLAGRR